MKKALCLAVMLCLVAAVPADAQNRRGSGELGVHAGFIHFDADLDDEFSVGIQIGINITDHVEVELDYTFSDTEISSTNIDVDAEYWSLGYIWNFRPGADITSPHVPYFTFGIGTGEFDVNLYGSRDPDFDFIYLGGGYRYFWTEVFGLRWDIRGIFTGDDGDLGDAFDADNVDVSTYLGLTWVLGG